jgi:hypothetical protein
MNEGKNEHVPHGLGPSSLLTTSVPFAMYK